MIYVTADLHFSHDNIIRHCDRPFRDVDAMNEKLIQNWNSLVKPDDEVYVLGDVTMKGPDQAFSLLSRLVGKKYLIRGNHDNFVDNDEWQQYQWVFGWVKDYFELTVDNQVFVLCHYPFLEWNQQRRGAIHLHGHQHNHADYNLQKRKQGLRRYDVGVDANGYTPLALKQIISFFASRR